MKSQRNIISPGTVQFHKHSLVQPWHCTQQGNDSETEHLRISLSLETKQPLWHPTQNRISETIWIKNKQIENKERVNKD